MIIQHCMTIYIHTEMNTFNVTTYMISISDNYINLAVKGHITVCMHTQLIFGGDMGGVPPGCISSHWYVKRKSAKLKSAC